MTYPSFQQMMSVDFRYNKTGKSLARYVEEQQPNYVVFIPNQSNSTITEFDVKTHLGLKK